MSDKIETAEADIKTLIGNDGYGTGEKAVEASKRIVLMAHRVAQLENVIDRIHTALGKSAFGPQTPEEVAVFVEERFKADDEYMANLKKNTDNARKKADDYREALDNAKIQIAKLKGQLEAF